MAGATNTIRLEAVGTTLTLYVEGVSTPSVTDATLTEAGKSLISNPIVTVPTATTGVHLDTFRAGSFA